MNTKIFSHTKKLTIALMAVAALYGIGRLYFRLTDGFSLSNIRSELVLEGNWRVSEPSFSDQRLLEEALCQEYDYLGKGCQSYVFGSRDGQYVIKFFKYKHFRPQSWINWFSFIPAVNRYQQASALRKQQKLEKVFRSWQLAYEYLRTETGVLYVHLTKDFQRSKPLKIYDKMGISHDLNLRDMEFLLQRKAKMLCPTLHELAAQGAITQAAALIDTLMDMLLSEYFRGFADNDHALMQNTGILEGRPIHIDVGQFIRNDLVKDPQIFKQEIYDKTYKLHLWLIANHPEMAVHLRGRLLALLGIDYYYMGPYLHKGDVGKIPNA